MNCAMKYLVLILFSIGLAKAESYISLDSEVTCFAAALYFESRGEILAASVGVAELIHTRLKSNYYSNTSCDLIKEKKYSAKHQRYICQFEWYCNIHDLLVDLSNQHESRAWQQAVVIAQSYLSDTPPVFAAVQHATLFHDDSKVPWWTTSPDVSLVAKIGTLSFYEEVRNGVLISKNDQPVRINVRS